MTSLETPPAVLARHGMARKLENMADTITERAPEDVATALRQAAECVQTLFIVKNAIADHLAAIRAADDAMVSAAVEAFLGSTGQAHTVTQLQRDLTTKCMRAALAALQPAAPPTSDYAPKMTVANSAISPTTRIMVQSTPADESCLCPKHGARYVSGCAACVADIEHRPHPADESGAVAALRRFVADAEEVELGGGDAVVTTCESLEIAKAALSRLAPAATGSEDAAIPEIRKVAKRNLRSLLMRSNDSEKELMLKCLEELS